MQYPYGNPMGDQVQNKFTIVEHSLFTIFFSSIFDVVGSISKTFNTLNYSEE